MPAWLGRLLMRLRGRLASGHVRFTSKATRELADFGFGAQYAVEVLRNLTSRDFEERIVGRHTGEWLYVFERSSEGVVIYV